MGIVLKFGTRISSKGLLIFTIFLALFFSMLLPATSCRTTATSPVKTYSVYQLEYLVFDHYQDFFWCDPDYYPIGSEEQEKRNAAEQFPAIRANESEFTAILEHLGIASKSSYSDEEILEIYREHKKLTRAIQVSASGTDRYDFSLRVGSGQGYLIKGSITASGVIRESSRENSINTCPICLGKGTLIATPAGDVPVENLSTGNLVWSEDDQGNRIEVRIERISRTQVPDGFQILEIILEDGRQITASPSHPTASGNPLGFLQPGNILDGSVIFSIARRPYAFSETFDILPAGPSGLYRANGILLMSTLKAN